MQDLELHGQDLAAKRDALEKEVREMGITISELDTQVKLNTSVMERQTIDFNTTMDRLTKRIRKAEEDRMSKYYKQVAELQDWKTKTEPII